ncbi:MAG TPA: hypothetical protein VLF39_04390 [Candidatus Saccharimonadales bacterium]|nr:hypothetical protein [Candidatus Saccharimonadales bacterium]
MKSAKDNQLLSKLVLITQRPIFWLPIFLVFLLVRNWQVFLLTDLHDGYGVKTFIVSSGLNYPGLKAYIHRYALQSYGGHFIPLWFAIFWLLIYLFDSNPYVLGLLSFAFAAWLLYLIYRLCLHFFDSHRNGHLYALLAAMIFSSSGFFLEAIAWKWMLGLVISTAFFCQALLILLRQKHSKIWLAIYSILLLGSVWTFGTSWMLCWGLVIFLLLQRQKKLQNYLFSTIAVSVVATITTLIANRHIVSHLNPVFILTNLPAVALMAAVNTLLQMFGVFRLGGVQHLYISSALAITILLALVVYYYDRHKHNNLSQKDQLVISLILAYLAIITLSLMRLMPVTGISPISSPENFIIGDRYMFVYSIPLFIALFVTAGKKMMNLPKLILYILIGGAIIYGVEIQINYSKIDPVIANHHRTEFYNLEPKALLEAQDQGLKLPDIDGDLFGSTQRLSRSVKIRKDYAKYNPQFVSPKSLTTSNCLAIHKSKDLDNWLNLYSSQWCN